MEKLDPKDVVVSFDGEPISGIAAGTVIASAGDKPTHTAEVANRFLGYTAGDIMAEIVRAADEISKIEAEHAPVPEWIVLETEGGSKASARKLATSLASDLARAGIEAYVYEASDAVIIDTKRPRAIKLKIPDFKL